jgi:hypothetical protein
MGDYAHGDITLLLDTVSVAKTHPDLPQSTVLLSSIRFV